MSIIRQIILWFAVPNMRNQGALLRFIVASVIACLIIPLTTTQIDNYLPALLQTAEWLFPNTMIATALGYIITPYLNRQPFGILIWHLCNLILYIILDILLEHDPLLFWQHFWQYNLFLLSFMYVLAARNTKLTPAVSEARLNALTARIRPHFLFNSLNAAISLIRLRPYDAEVLLENLANLFRAQLKDSSQTSTLGQEIEWAQEYIAIEQIRMGSTRLQVMWQHDAPDNAITPHLLLQPLLENAVFHGIESSHRPGMIIVYTRRKSQWVFIRIENPFIARDNPDNINPHKGNSMALRNLKERLHLLYDNDAVVNFKQTDSTFIVEIRLPYRPEEVSEINKLFG